MDNMLQRQIVIKALGTQLDNEDPAYMKYDPGTSFQSMVWMLRFDIVTIKRNAIILQRYESNHYVTTIKLRSCI
jgi:hypothetical protein